MQSMQFKAIMIINTKSIKSISQIFLSPLDSKSHIKNANHMPKYMINGKLLKVISKRL